MKIAYFGLPLGALLLAEDGHELEPVVLSPVAAPGRRRLARRIGRHRLLEAEAEDVEQRLALAEPDVIVSWFWTRRLPRRWLEVPRLGGIGVHPSLLPRHRGPNPFFAAIDAGDTWTGVSVHRLEEDYDTGEVLERLAIQVGERDAWQLARALDAPSLCALRAVVSRLAAGERVRGVPQDEARASWAPEPWGDLAKVEWTWPTARILRRIRALAPVPGLALEIRGVAFFVTRAEPAEAAELPGALLAGEAACAGSRVLVRTGDGAIALTAVSLGASGEGLDAAELAARVCREPHTSAGDALD